MSKHIALKDQSIVRDFMIFHNVRNYFDTLPIKIAFQLLVKIDNEIIIQLSIPQTNNVIEARLNYPSFLFTTMLKSNILEENKPIEWNEYRTFIYPYLSNIDLLYFVLPQELLNFPFQLIWMGDGELFKHVPIAFHLSLHELMRIPKIVQSCKPSIILGNIDLDLYGVGVEANNLAIALKTYSFIGRYLRIKDIELYTREMKLIHIAGHCYISEKNTENICIPFPDGLLTPSRIQRLSLSAPLVFLSGCSTAYFPSPPNTYEKSLINAFIKAGARSVIGSIFPLLDDYNITPIRGFYNRICKGYFPAKALSDSMIEQSKYAPFNYLRWGGFVLYGSWS